MKPLTSGKVRDIYSISNDKLIIVATDRISAYDVVLPKPVAGKGKVLNALSLFWFNYTKGIIPNHIITGDAAFFPLFFRKKEFEGRTVLVEKLKVLPFEFVVRGYIYGNMWKEYCEGGEFCGEKFRRGYKLADKLDKPVLTISTKTDEGHDEYLTFWRVADKIGVPLLGKIKEKCLALYEACYHYAYDKGLIIADTKFEFGLDKNDNLVLADEICTPDSSRIWSLAEYEPGISPLGFDKQILRDWLSENNIQFDAVPDELLEKLSQIYRDCYEKILS